MTKRNKPSKTGGLLVTEYHTAAFRQLTQTLAKEIRQALLVTPPSIIVDYWRDAPRGCELSQQVVWENLKTLLEKIESIMAEIISQHSAYYWIHLYRRIGVSLASHRDKTDAMTTFLVRLVLETAFLKYSNLQKTSDIELSNNMTEKEVLGGVYEQVAQLVPKNHRSKLGLNWSDYMRSPCWALREFTSSDFVNIYALEGLSKTG